MPKRSAKTSPPRVSFGPASDHLSAIDDDWAGLIARVGAPAIAIQADREPYEQLTRAIAHQQVHGRAAEAILGRFLALYPGVAFPTPAQIRATDPDTMRACGFSFAKIATIHGIAKAADEGVVPSRVEADGIADEDLIARLVTLKGIGRWTVEMLLMFTLGRPDILPVDDFGVREGFKVLKSLPAQPKPKALAEIGLPWSPYRTTAAWYLWRSAEQGRNVKPSEVTGG